MSDIATMMQAANPVPDSKAALTDDEFNALLLLTQSRSGNVDVQELTKPVEPEKKGRNRGWLVAAAAFAVVIIALGVTLLIGRSATDLEPAAPPTTQAAPPTTDATTPTTVPVVEEEAVEVTTTTVAVVEDVLSADDQAYVDSLFAAFNSADKESFLALVSPSVGYTSYLLQNAAVEEWSKELDWRWALNEQWAVESCDPSFGAISCRITISGGAFHLDGSEEAVLRLLVADGIATTVTLTEALSSVIPEATEFVAWMEAEYPDDLPLMLSNTEPPSPSLADESIALWAVRYPEWEATLDG